MRSLTLGLLLASSTAMAQPTVLMVGTSHAELGNTGKGTGVWLSELTHAYDEFIKAGIKVEFASIDGNGFPLDPGSLGELDASALQFIADNALRQRISDEQVLSLKEAGTNQYDAVYLTGGHGVMWDFKGNDNLDQLLADTYQDNGVIGAVCHGVAGLLTATNADGELLVHDKQLTGFSDEEEAAIKLTEVVPYSLEQALTATGADYSQADDMFSNYSVVDGRLVTGQNPASASSVAKHMVELLK